MTQGNTGNGTPDAGILQRQVLHSLLFRTKPQNKLRINEAYTYAEWRQTSPRNGYAIAGLRTSLQEGRGAVYEEIKEWTILPTGQRQALSPVPGGG